MRSTKPTTRAALHILLAALCACTVLWSAQTQYPPVIVQTETISNAKKMSKSGANAATSHPEPVVAWLTPLGATAALLAANPVPPSPARMVQKSKTFAPHLLVVPTGAVIDFPNQDPFLHNVFSLFDGKRFDLGFYEAGSTKNLHFDRQGISFLFCNIHPEMSGVIVSLDTPYFATSDTSGRIVIANVPDGRYRLDVWYERSLPEELKALSKIVLISGSTRTLEPVKIVLHPGYAVEHKNKYGQDYIPPADTTPGYGHP